MIRIFQAKTRDDALYEMLLDLKRQYNDKEHYVFLVPDRVSVLCEKMIFEVLGIESTVNIEVLTLSRLSSRLLKDMRVISREDSCMIMQKALLANSANLKCFKRNLDSSLSACIFGTISQFKSCKIEPSMVEVGGEASLLRDKLSDIATLYASYEDLLHQRGLFDSMDRLNILPRKIKFDTFARGSHFYCAMFDGFTIQGYEIISTLMHCAKCFNIGLCVADNPLNEHIYDTAFASNILSICPEDSEHIVCHEHFNDSQKHIAKYLFSLNHVPAIARNNEISLFEGENFEEEIVYACCEMKRLIKDNGYRSEDFFIAVPNLKERYVQIKRILDQFSFSYYIDLSQNFSESCVFLLVKSFLQIIRDDWDVSGILSFVTSPLLSLDRDDLEDFIDYVSRYKLDSLSMCQTFNIRDENSFDGFDRIRTYLMDLKNSVGEDFVLSKTYGEFVSSCKKFADAIGLQDLLDAQVTDFNSAGDERNARLFEEYYDKLQELLDRLCLLLGGEDANIQDFISTLLSGASSTAVSTVPLSVDAIFVGDASASFFERRRTGFILCASREDFPSVQNDVGLITDKDIAQVSEKYRLEPSIKEINRKERFKAFELLLKPTERLYLSYNFDKGAMCSQILSDVMALFVQENGEALSFERMEDLPLSVKNSCEDIARHNLVRALRATIDRQKEGSVEDAVLYNAMKYKLGQDFLNNFFYKNNKVIDENIFFTHGRTSISQIERYMSCPFMHYMEYGLKVRDREVGDIDSRQVGSFMHSFVELFLKNTSLPTDEDITDSVQKIFSMTLLGKEYLNMFTTPSDEVFKKNLFLEAKRLALALNYQAKHMKFIPKYFECKFDDAGEIKSLKFKTRHGLMSLVGKIDRVDFFGDYFRVIDYKTGNVEYGLEDLFFGKKIQLEAYIKTVSSSLKLKCAGAYYFPIKNNLNKDDESVYKKYRLRGKTLNSYDVLTASDSSLDGANYKSDIVEVSTIKDGSISKLSKVADSTQMKSLSEYAYKLIQRAVEDILTLDITPRPLFMDNGGVCKGCKYHSICQFDTAFGGVKRMTKKELSLNDFVEEE